VWESVIPVTKDLKFFWVLSGSGAGWCWKLTGNRFSGHSFVTSKIILDEMSRNLLKKVKLPKQLVRDIIDYLQDIAEVVEPDPVNSSVCRDKDDLPVIGTATKGKALCIVAGDADLLSLKKYHGIDIISPGIMGTPEIKIKGTLQTLEVRFPSDFHGSHLSSLSYRSKRF